MSSKTSSSKSRIKKDTQKFMTLTEKGVAAFQQGRHRESADYYLEAVLVAGAQSSDKWMDINSSAPSARYHSFHGYTSILREKYFVPSKRDFTSLADLFLYNETEPIIFRVEAGHTLGLISWDKGDREEAADFYRDVISLGNQVTREENARLYVGVPDNCTTVPARPIIRKVEMGIKEIVKLATENLEKLQNRKKSSLEDLLAPMTYPRSDGTSYPQEMRNMGFSVPVVLKYTSGHIDPHDLMQRLAVGGNACDCCHKTFAELGMPKLSRCTRCEMAYYCGTACQRQKWKHGGHKACCRTRGQIEKQDIMRLLNLNYRKDLNGTLAIVMDKVMDATATASNESPSRWKVRVMNAAEEIVSVAEKNIEHIRPEK
jgi:MYND finger